MPEPAALLSAQIQRDLETIKGWFNPSDRRMFAWLLRRQRDLDRSGGIVELGCYLGKSTVLLGDFVADDEPFVVLDLFESDAPDESNTKEMRGSYSALTQEAFEANFLRFHEKLPTVIKAPSSAIVDHVEPGSCRFVHVDASHLYEHVSGDVDAAKILLQPDGVVVFDDYRSEHTPGVSAAVWEAVFTKGMRPICVTESKFYGTWGDPEPLRAAIETWLTEDSLGWCERQQVAGHPMLRVKVKLPPDPAPASTPTPPPTPPKSNSRLRKIAQDWLPPVISRALRKRT